MSSILLSCIFLIFNLELSFCSLAAGGQALNQFGQLFNVKVHPPPSQDRSLRGQHRIGNSVFDFSLLCADGIPLLMEDHKPRPCQPRPWLPEHRCPTGFWCHEGGNEASFYCCARSRKFANRCHLPPAVGYGKQRMRRFYYDWKTDACHELQYSGIGGNENSFMDYEKCEATCRGAGEPPIPLPSNMKIVPKEKKNELVEKNEKKTIFPKEAAEVPVSLKPPLMVPKNRISTTTTTTTTTTTAAPSTTTTTTPIAPTTTNKNDEKPQAFEVFFTVPNPSNKKTKTTIEEESGEKEQENFHPNPCGLDVDRGRSGGVAINMWYFDQSTSTCSPFTYLGKGGNSNRFKTSHECTETCGIGKPTRKSCALPPAIGNGPFNIPRFYFDRVTNKCERFFYSGSDGNDNRFYRKNKCERLCLRKKPKKKEKTFEFSTPSFTNPPTLLPTPMRIVQNLKPDIDETASFEFTSRMVTEPSIHITVEPWVEVATLSSSLSPSSSSDHSQHPTLINEPRGETIPAIISVTSTIETTTTPNIVDHVFSNLMNSQHHKLVELVNKAEIPMITDSPIFGSVEQQPIPPDFSNQKNSKPFENEYGMKIEPYYPSPSYGHSTRPLSIDNQTIMIQQPTSSVAQVNQSSTTLPTTPIITTTTTTTTSLPIVSTIDPAPVFKFIFPTTTTIHVDPTTLPPPPPTVEIKKPVMTTTTTTTTTTTPFPFFFFNITQSAINDSPCVRHLFGDATIMCESQPQICPIGTFCQIGNGQSICCPILDDPPCEQPIEMGVGTSPVRRWYFDPATRLCQPFQFNGFKGNQNNFLNYEDCSRACGSTNICQIGSPVMSYHTHLLSCSSSLDCEADFLCVQSTPHNLCCRTPPPPSSQSLPSSLVIDFVAPTTICQQPIDVGHGHQAEHRWAFSNGQCVSFLFSGQGGNMNNFLTRTDCVKNCQNDGNLSPHANRCSQPASSGHGEQYLSRYFYSPEYRQCLHFIYSGESGNSNNFETLTECLETCVANGIKFSSLAKLSPTFGVATTTTLAPKVFSLYPRHVCPQGDPLVTIDGTPIQCDPTTNVAKCPGDHVCSPSSTGQAFCCPSPMHFCLQNRPALNVCTGPDFQPIREIRFTYDPLADRCVRFNFQNCRGPNFAPTTSLNNFVSNSQCNRLCCNQGYNLVYKRRLLMTMSDDPSPE